MKHAGPLDQVAPRYSDFSACDPGMINDESSQAPVNIVVIAENKAVAQSWITQTLHHCKPGVDAGGANYGRFQFLACAYDQPLPANGIHEAHIIINTEPSGIQWRDFSTQARRVFLHHIGVAAEADIHGAIQYRWNSPEAGIAFCGGLFSMLARPGIIGLTWEDYIDLLPDSSFAQGLQCGAEDLDTVISGILDRVAALPSERATLALLHIDANGDFSLGDYVDVCSAVEENLPPLCRLIATVSITDRAKWCDVQLAFFAP